MESLSLSISSIFSVRNREIWSNNETLRHVRTIQVAKGPIFLGKASKSRVLSEISTTRCVIECRQLASRALFEALPGTKSLVSGASIRP